MKEKTKKNDIFEIAFQRMYSALNSYYIWKILNQSINIHNTQGPDGAQKNLDLIINKYRYFFHTIIFSSYKTFIIDLSVFFDSNKYENNFSVKKLVEKAKETNREVDALKLLKDIDNIKKPHRKLIALILKLRNQDVAHQALDPNQHVLIYSEVESLFGAVHEILNKISLLHDNSISSWSNVEKDMKHDIDWIYENLETGELERIEKIKKKWDVDI